MSGTIYKNASATEEFIKIKHRGKVFTPDYLVEDILNQGHYVEGNINKKHIIDNSCGDGQFMIHIIDRYCSDFLNISNDLTELKKQLETYIHSIEIEKEELDVCIQRCEKVANLYNIFDVHWDFVNADSLTYNRFDKMMDFVIGNPPYVRVHNLNEDFCTVKNYLFGNGGMTDLFIVFYEIGLKMLNDNGILCYITPSSFFTSLAGENFRNYLIDYSILESVCDLKHFQPFEATTYTTIVCINKAKKTCDTDYYEFDEKTLKQVLIDKLCEDEYCINGCFYFSTKYNLKILKNIIQNNCVADVNVKNGYATLADKIFISDFKFSSKFIIPVVKASRGQWSKIFYPYDKSSKLVSEKELEQDKEMYSYLISQKEKLKERTSEKDVEEYWYAFGRSQGINDTYKEKISINSLIRTSKDLKLVDVPSGCGVYSGLYIVSDTIDTKTIKNALLNEEFGIYVSLLGKYKSGGYYTFSSKDVKTYLNYKIGKEVMFNVEQ